MIQAGHGSSGQGAARHGPSWQGQARRGAARQGKAFMSQGELFSIEQTAYGPMARIADPETSHAAAEAIQAKLPELHRWTVQCVRETPGLTAGELGQRWCATDPRKIGRRLHECEEMGWLRRGPSRNCSKSGRSCETWWPVERADALPT